LTFEIAECKALRGLADELGRMSAHPGGRFMTRSRSLSAITTEIIVALARGIMEVRRHADADQAIVRELAGGIDAMADLLVLNRSMLEVIRDVLLRTSPAGGQIEAELVAQIEVVVRRVEGDGLSS